MRSTVVSTHHQSAYGVNHAVQKPAVPQLPCRCHNVTGKFSGDVIRLWRYRRHFFKFEFKFFIRYCDQFIQFQLIFLQFFVKLIFIEFIEQLKFFG